MQWIINAYALVQAGLLLLAGNVADHFGRKKMLLAGLAVFGGASLAAGLARDSAQLIAARAGMSVGQPLRYTGHGATRDDVAVGQPGGGGRAR